MASDSKPVLTVKPARGVELKLCRMLMGNEASTHPHYELFLALADSGEPLGVGSLHSGVEQLNEPWGVHLALVPPPRSHAVAQALLAYASARAAAQGATYLQTLRWYRPESAEHSHWTSLGFTPRQLRYAHEITVSRSQERLTPIVGQIREHGWIPSNARIIPLAEANVSAVVGLHIRHLGGTRRELTPLLDGTAPQPYDRQASLVLLCGEQTMGFTLGRFPEPNVCEVSANVLDPAVRWGWADLTLKYAALQVLIKRKVERLRFFTAEQHTDSRRSLEWVGGGSTWQEVRLQISCRAPQPSV